MNNFHTSSDLFLNLNNPHPLIERENTYHLSRKLLTVHANDRDIMYYPNSNEFSIKCPQAYTNVQSMRLNEISFPNSIYNFSEKLDNNTFKIGIDINNMKTVTIPDGFYDPPSLQLIMNNRINSVHIDTKVAVEYIKQQDKFIITNDHPFYLQHTNLTNCKSKQKTDHFTYNYKEPLNKNSLPGKTYLLNTGFLYAIGFDLSNKSNLISSTNINDISNEIAFVEDIYPNMCVSDSCTRFRNRQPIYLEIDRHNLYDELNPYPKGSSNLYNNYSNSSTSTAFVKIPATVNGAGTQDYSKVFDHLNNNVVFFEPPLQRLQNFKFKFRYHDGYLVDLNNQDVNFTLEINQLRNEIPRHLNIRTPAL